MKGFALSFVSRVKNKILVFGLLALTTGAAAQKAAGPNPEGRWDITVYDNDQQYPSWLEVYHSGHKRLVGHYVGITGRARPISIVHF